MTYVLQINCYFYITDGLIWVTEWNALQHAVASAFLAVIYSDYMLTSRTPNLKCDSDSFTPSDLRDFAKSQVCIYYYLHICLVWSMLKYNLCNTFRLITCWARILWIWVFWWVMAINSRNSCIIGVLQFLPMQKLGAVMVSSGLNHLIQIPM